MYNNPFFMPGYNIPMASPTFLRGGIPATRVLTTTALKGANTTSGLLSRLGAGFSGIKSINWGGLINNTSKTLGIINQTIPIVRQVGPMVNNMRSMLRVASLFKDETDIKIPTTNNINTTNNYIPNNTNTTIPNKNTNQSSSISNQITATSQNRNYTTQNEQYSESPTFFINT